MTPASWNVLIRNLLQLDISELDNDTAEDSPGEDEKDQETPQENPEKQQETTLVQQRTTTKGVETTVLQTETTTESRTSVTGLGTVRTHLSPCMVQLRTALR
ncbi:hypothetical protein ACOMHN_004624 [Nucella lapillus]